jgi:hypothetical protein
MWALLSRVTRIISMSESADFKREFLAALCGKTLHLMLRILHVDIHTQNIPIDTSAPEGEKRVLIATGTRMSTAILRLLFESA